MKKIYLIVLLISTINAIGQNYKFTMKWDPLQQVGGYYRLLGTGGYQIDYYSQNNNGQIQYKDYEIKLDSKDFKDYLSFELVLNSCNDPYTQPPIYFITDLLKYGENQGGYENCGGNGTIMNFTTTEIFLDSQMSLEYPQGNPPHYKICAGEQLAINAKILNKPNILAEGYYPPEAYHWWCFLDSDKTWREVPDKILKDGILVDNLDYNKPRLNNTMEEIIGPDHEKYYNTIIYFHLGRNNPPASLNYGVLYSPCAPVVQGKITYEAPNCSDGSIKSITIPFDRELEEKGLPGEELLKDMAIRNSDPPFNIIKQITQPVTYQGKTYSFPTDGLNLTSGKTYYITYQSFKNGIPRGSMHNINDSFTYIAPQPLAFTITANNATCFNDNGKISITAHGGTGDYYYYSLDGGANKIQFTNKTVETTQDNIITRTGIQDISLPVSDQNKIYNIKVSDINGCLEPNSAN
jgi:hypothetical protein